MKNNNLPLIVITGPTASGKTGLAIEMAKKFNGEIICADSRSVYKGMDIGTAKPTRAEQLQVPHWGLDLVEPNEYFSVADFKSYAVRRIDEIRRRGHAPFVVGGTGLYVDAIIFDYEFGGRVDIELRNRLELMSVEQLQNHCIKNNISLPENSKNKRYLIRAIETKETSPSRKNMPIPNSIIVGIATERDVLRSKIAQRSEQLFEDGVVNEATLLGKKYGWSSEAMTGNIYSLVHAYLNNEMSLEEIKDRFKTLDWRLAKRQLTWLRRNPHIQWYTLQDATRYLNSLLANR
jgi:tRNA dimethylallyltransferase